VATAPTGGRLVSLVDGREYPIAATGVVIGRDAGCDVVVPHAEVSRRHAEIVPAQSGYVLTDLSTNGVFVNGDRVKYSALLGRGDVIRLGAAEFRFHADVRAAASSVRSVRPATGQAAPVSGTTSRTMWALLVIVAVAGVIAFLVLR
jgi:pSer/pThr/pTyr-binding forkhead associated (FHA) protein